MALQEHSLGLFPATGLGNAKAIGVDLAYQAVMYQARGVNNNPDNRYLNGEWDTTLHVGAISFRAAF